MNIKRRYFKNRLEDIADRISKKLGLSQGILKFDIVLNSNRIEIIEFATRLSGGGFSTETIPAVYRYNLIQNFALMELGLKPTLPP